MDKLTLDRWTEIQFYFICLDVISVRNNIMDLMDFIDNMTLFGRYEPERIKPLAQEILSSLRYRPSKEELCLICHKFKVPVAVIKQKTGIHNRTLYQLLDADEKDPRMFYPRFRQDQTDIIQTFVDTFNNFKKVGLT